MEVVGGLNLVHVAGVVEVFLVIKCSRVNVVLLVVATASSFAASDESVAAFVVADALGGKSPAGHQREDKPGGMAPAGHQREMFLFMK